jgi:hypothetical protein
MAGDSAAQASGDAERAVVDAIRLPDGAPAMLALRRKALDESTLGTTVYELLDFWHVLQKLAPAAAVVYGEARGSEVLAQWRLDLLNRKVAVDEILTALIGSGKRAVRVGATRPVHEAITYPGARRPVIQVAGAISTTVRHRRSSRRRSRRPSRGIAPPADRGIAVA